MRDVLTTERLTLRPLKAEDAGPISLHASDAKVARMLARMPHPYPPGAAEAFIETALSGRLKEAVYAIDILQTDSTDMVGVVSLKDRDKGVKRLGYWLGAPAWGRGVGTEAVRAVIDEAFADDGVQRIASDVFLDNLASRRVLAKSGFEFGETFEQFCPARGEPVASQHCELDRVAWLRLKQSELQ